MPEQQHCRFQLDDCHRPASEVYELMQEGKSKKEIVDYMVARYGNFVTYDPPLTPLTVLLWVLPVVAIGIGGWVI